MVENSNKNIIESLKNGINKQFKNFKPAYSLNDDDAPTNVLGWVSTGSSILDFAISNKKNGGIPVGKITELSGLEGAGKSLIAAHICAETQKLGGIAVFFDTESAVSREFFQAIGINLDDLLYLQLDTVEDIYKTIDNIISEIRNKDKQRLVTIVIDSLTSAKCEAELENDDYEIKGYSTHKARINSASLKRFTSLIALQNIALVITSQLRQNVGAFGFGDPYVTSSGGMALQFYSSVRIRLKKIGRLSRTRKGVKEIIGVKARAIVNKNRLGPPHRQADFDIYFDSGIDNYNSWLTSLKQYNIAKKTTGNSYKIVDKENNREWEFTSQSWMQTVNTDEDLRKYVYDKLAEELIMIYRNISELNIDEIQSEETADSDE